MFTVMIITEFPLLILKVSIYQEQLTQMQMDLEAGLEAVSEVVANRGGGEAQRNIPLHYLNITKAQYIRVAHLVEANPSIDLFLYII